MNSAMSRAGRMFVWLLVILVVLVVLWTCSR